MPKPRRPEMCTRPAPDRTGYAATAPRKHRPSRPDGRTTSARRFTALVAAFTSEIGGTLTESESGLVRQAAALALRCEDLQAAIVRGEVIDDDLLVRISGTAKRLLGAIGAKTKPTGGGAFQEYLAKHAAQAADDTDED